MKLANATLLPGVVTSAEDPQNLGRIKCIIAGVSNPDTMNQDHLPWCAPLTCFGNQRVSKPMEGAKVWVLHDEDNYYEYYYLPSWEVNGNTEDVTGDDSYDVLVSRPGEGFGSQQFYSDDKGFVTRIGNDLSTTMTKDGTIMNTDGNVELGITDSHCYAGAKDGSWEPMVLGDQLYKLLNDLSSKLNATGQTASSSCYTSHLSQPLMECAKAINNHIEQILSQNSLVN